MKSDIEKSISPAAAMTQAIEAGELELHYQPQVHLRTGRVDSAEALVRWRRYGTDLLPPRDFIPRIEKMGMTGRLTRWVVEDSLRTQRKWRDGGRQIRIAINLSASDLHDTHLADDIARFLKVYRCEPHWIELEVTESAAVADPALAASVLKRFQSMGIALALDDFGKRYSTFEYLRTLPFDAIKLDKSFVKDMVARRVDGRIVRSILDMARNLRLGVTAEGVESIPIYRSLAAQGCERMQGFLISPPLPEPEFVAWHDSLDGGRWDTDQVVWAKPDPTAPAEEDQPLRVLVVEDHTLVRQSVVKAISAEPGMEVIGQSDSGEEALESGRGGGPDLALLDIQLPGIDGIETARRLRRENPEIRIIFLTMLDDDETIMRAVEVGADGYIAKTASTEELIDAIQTIIDGGSYLSPPIANRVIGLARAGYTRRVS